jgi:hypothetical protein
MRARSPTALLLAGLLALTAYSPTPAAGQGKEPPKADPAKDKDKEPPKGPTKLPEHRWPTNIGGKGLHDWLKDATESPDPAVREFALRTLPNFGPDARKDCSKKLLARMTAEKDPGVRITVFNAAATIGLEDEDIKPAVQILGRIVDEGARGGLSRLHAVQTLGLIGPKAYPAVTHLCGVACDDPSYETRRSIAHTLGRVAFDESTGPNVKALSRLAGTFAKDESAAVRMEALQSLVILGPPWQGPVKGKAVPVIDWKAAEYVADRMRARVGAAKAKEPVETDKQLEIWCRVVLMRFDPKELANPGHMTAIANHIGSEDLGPKLQALQALALFGEQAGGKIDDVMKALKVDEPEVKTIADFDPLVLTTALNTLGAMGVAAHGALPRLEAIEKKLALMRDEKVKSDDFKKLTVDLKPEQTKQVIASLNEEQLRTVVANTIEFIKKSKPGLPGGGSTGTAPGPVEKKP